MRVKPTRVVSARGHRPYDARIEPNIDRPKAPCAYHTRPSVRRSSYGILTDLRLKTGGAYTQAEVRKDLAELARRGLVDEHVSAKDGNTRYKVSRKGLAALQMPQKGAPVGA